MPDVRAGEKVLTAKTVIGALIGVLIGFLILPLLWTSLLNILAGIEWIAALISFGIFILGYKLVKYTEGAPDVLGAIILMLGYTLLVFSVLYWAPIIALHIPFIFYGEILTWGLIIGAVAFVIGLVLIKKYTSEQKHLNDIGEVIGIIYGGFMLYVWVTNIFIIPLLKSLGVNILAQLRPWDLSVYF